MLLVGFMEKGRDGLSSEGRTWLRKSREDVPDVAEYLWLIGFC